MQTYIYVIKYSIIKLYLPMLPKIIYTFICLFIFKANLVAQNSNLPPDLPALPAYKSFVHLQKIRKQETITLPQSNYLLIYVSIERTDDQAAWSVASADGLVAKIFVYDKQKHSINLPETEQLNKVLGADKFYQPNFCGGLGSFETWNVEKNKVVLLQTYAPASEIIDCKVEIYFDGKNILTSKTANNATDGLAGMAGKERNQKNAEALKLLQNKKIPEAIKIWEELYGYIKNGSYATEGNIDEFMNNLGFAYWKIGKYPEAEKILLECAMRFPNRYAVYVNLADVYRDMKNKTQAITYYTKIMQLPTTAKQKEYAKAELKKLGK